MNLLIDDGMQISVGTGIGKYTAYLFYNLNEKKGKNDKVEIFRFDKGKSGKKWGRIKYIFYINSKQYRRYCARFEVIHYTNYLIPFIREKKVKYAVTVHDLAAFMKPKSLPIIYRCYNRFIIKYGIKNSDIVFTVSKSVKREIIDKWPQFADKVCVAYPGFYDEYSVKRNNVKSEKYISEKLYGLKKQKFFLYVGTIEKRKNLGIVIQAFLRFKERNLSDYKLVLAGRPGYGFDEYKRMVGRSQYCKDIIFTGYIEAIDCQKLYREATAYIFPTIYEGFGSTQLECMANHTPIILSDIPTNREVSGEYGIYFSLDNTDELINKMEFILAGKYDHESKNRLADEILKCYDWNSVLSSYINGYERLI